MKTTMHCWLLYGVAAAITLSGLAGCGSDSNNNNSVSTSPVQVIPLPNRADLVSCGNA